MRTLRPSILVLGLLIFCGLGWLHGASVGAQAPEDPGAFDGAYRQITFANTYPGSSSISCLVAYPGTSPGSNAPLDTSAAPYPVIVFGHGFTNVGDNYRTLALHYASWGFIVIAPDTYRFGPLSSLGTDLEAMVKVARDENGRSGSFLFNALDVNNIGVSGHSMGGGASAKVLGTDPSVRAGVLLAPWVGTGQDASDWMLTARTPFLVLVGNGDIVTPPSSNASRFYQKGAGVDRFRGMVTLWSGCTHSSVANPGNSQNSQDAFRLCRRQMTAFMLAHLQGRHEYLDVTVGVATNNEPRFDAVDYRVIDPDLYLTGVPRVGGAIDYHVMAKASTVTTTYLAPAAANVPIPGLGTLGLHPAVMFPLSSRATGVDQVLHETYPIPNLPGLAGLALWIQAAGQDEGGAYRLTPTRKLTVIAAS